MTRVPDHRPAAPAPDARALSKVPQVTLLFWIVKIAATIGILAIAIKGYADLHWPSMLIALVVASQASFLAFWKKT